MSKAFLKEWMVMVQRISGAERACAVTADLHICAVSGLDEAALKSSNFVDFITETLRSALQQGQPVFTNNLIRDMDQAPTTNTHLSEMRFVVAIPLVGVGAVYLDQPIRMGVISRQVVQKLYDFGLRALTDEALLSASSAALESAFASG
ncbi:MAG: hypothetical protein NZ750_11800 [Anaerolineae bacterium]|nr:hypothetical protein [Anaerolineae bacterium]MDW8173955.1 hypothetical protein [Anaerolineae bacterium]